MKEAAAACGAVAIALAGCVPDPGGSCSSDGDCAGGAAGLFCAEGVCQSPPRASLEEMPRTSFGRGHTATLRVRVDRAHGGAETATGSLHINGHALPAVPEPGGRLRFEVPLGLGPAGVEASVPVEISVADDLGHATVLSDSLVLDDLPPRVFIEADTVPSRPVPRGTVVQLRVHAFDASPLTLLASAGTSLARQLDGAFLMAVDTGALDPSAMAAEPMLTATDSVGLRASASARFAVAP